MRDTGIIRRIDDLGRVVIPRDVRIAKGIREGDPFEIFVDKDRIILKKYSASVDVRDHTSALRDLVQERSNMSSEDRDLLLQKITAIETAIDEAESKKKT